MPRIVTETLAVNRAQNVMMEARIPRYSRQIRPKVILLQYKHKLHKLSTRHPLLMKSVVLLLLLGQRFAPRQTQSIGLQTSNRNPSSSSLQSAMFMGGL